VPVTPGPVPPPPLRVFLPLVAEPAADNYAWVQQDWADHALFGDDAHSSVANEPSVPSSPAPVVTDENTSSVPALAPPALLFEARSTLTVVPAPSTGSHPATWFEARVTPPPAPATERVVAPPARSQSEAVRAFDRGLGLLRDKLYAAALAEWERAVALDPDNRTYQVNLRRLRERRAAHDDGE
jgi:hypothetical protein